MAFDDKLIGTLFPVRNGAAIGSAGERKMLEALGGAGGIRKRFQIAADGSVTMLVTRNGQPEFTTEIAHSGGVSDPPADYMTSGAFVFGPLGGINVKKPELTLEPVTRKASNVSGVEARVLNSLYIKLPPNDGEVSKIYNQTTMPSGLNAPKQIMARTPPSIFSGLMRRWVQAQYGTGNVGLKSGPNGVDEDFLVGFDATYARTTGVLRFGQRYVLVALETKTSLLTVTCYPITFPAKYVKLLQGVVQGSADHEALETLALSRAVASNMAGTRVGQYPIPNGTPLDYGWNFSLTENTATIVVRTPTDVHYDKNLWSRMILTFSGSESVTGIVTCAYVLAEQKEGWMVTVRSPMWVKAEGGMVCVNNAATSPSPTSDQDVPVYAYYVRDELRVVRWKWQASSFPLTFDSEKWSADYSNSAWGAEFFGEGTASFSVSQEYGDSPLHGFYISGLSYAKSVPANRLDSEEVLSLNYDAEPDSSTLSPYVWPEQYQGGGLQFYYGRDYYARTDYNPITKNGPLLGFSSSIPYPVPLKEYSCATVTGASGHLISTARNTTGSQASCLVVPSSDCSAVYIGYSEHYSITTTRTRFGKVATVSKCDEYEVLALPGTGTSIYFETAGHLGRVRAQYNMADLPSGDRLYNIDGDYSTRTDTSQNDVYEMMYYGGEIKLAGDGKYSLLYQPTSSDGFFGALVSSISSSIFNDCRYSAGNMTDAMSTSGYPKNITLFIGAS